MRSELKRKTTRTVHGDKVVRLRIDIPYEDIESYGSEKKDMNQWLDMRVDEVVNIDFSDFVDEDQLELEEIENE